MTTLADLTEPDLDATTPFPWPTDSGHTVADMLAWANIEVMKNAAEIGQLRRGAAPLPTCNAYDLRGGGGI
ncbi:hypothetical protein [Streptomyces cellulosae]|uniref:hypothetical protein n=1 Tax=Streptomyces cellulosae TaxID=1968 RepID=UPI00387EB023